MRKVIIAFVILIISSNAAAQKIRIDSPNKKINAALFNRQNRDIGEWYLKITGNGNDELIPRINLGLSRSDQDFSKELKLVKVSKPLLVNEKYTALHGKRAQCSNSANEVVVSFENPGKADLNLIIRAYNDGIAFRYEFLEKSGSFVIKDELTSYAVPEGTKRWMEKWDLGNEALYTFIKDKNIQQTWSYPALFNSPDSACWYLIHEADVNRTYCGSKLSNMDDKSEFKITFPDPGDGEGESQPAITLPWKSPWRVIIIGSLADIVESTLIDDVSPPSILTKTDWIKPGKASWNYWSNNHGTKDYKVVCEFADLAAAMDWEYTLLDWEWDQMSNGGNLEDALKYIHSKGVKPLMWYNSGAFKWVQATPRDRMLTHENRIQEFAKLKKLGVAGVKVDFFLSEKQNMIKYYLDILDDAAEYGMMVYFHGCLVPRGWERTYPHLMTCEAVRGAEWYNNGPEFTTTAPEHNTVIPFTRNVVGSMDYTPVTFTNSQFPHLTSYGHELALSVVFESGIQHMADRPSGYYELPDAAKTFLKEVPNAWDDTKLIDGYPGKDIFIARLKQNIWYVGGLNAEIIEKKKTLKLDFLQEGIKYKLTLITDGKHDKELTTSYMEVDKSSSIDIKLLRRGGFAASLKPIE
ncbi:MAG TPA: glycoside hydrolase family 97 catalytic domain-containing protein [Ignavibacteriaceae bacterium]|nr:glycoside hydrolase family 97 catalytic domain-containing protein [Ignavibacteriaceae bacterium]